MPSSRSTAKNPLFATSRQEHIPRLRSAAIRDTETIEPLSYEFAKYPTTLGQCQGADPVGHLPNRDASYLFHFLHIDGGDRLHPTAGNVNCPAVRSESDPGWIS